MDLVPGSKARIRKVFEALNSKLIRSFMAVALVRLLGVPLTLLSIILLARGLGPTEFGQYNFAISLAIVLSLPVGLGFMRLAVRETAYLKNQGAFPELKAVWRRGNQVIVLYSLVAFGVAGVLFFMGVITGIHLFSVALIPIVALLDLQAGILRGLDRTIGSLVPTMVIRPLGLFVVVLALFWGEMLALERAIAAYVVSALIAAGASYWLFFQSRPAEITQAFCTHNDRRLINSYPIFFMIAVTTFAVVDILVLMLNGLSGPESGAALRLAWSGAQLANLPGIAVGMLMGPKFALLKGADPAQIRRTYLRATQLAFVSTALAGAPLFVFAGPIVAVIFGEAYVAQTASTLRLLVISNILLAFVGPSSMFLGMIGAERYALVAQLLGLGVILTTVTFAAPRFGASAAGAAMVLGTLTITMTEFLKIKKDFGFVACFKWRIV